MPKNGINRVLDGKKSAVIKFFLIDSQRVARKSNFFWFGVIQPIAKNTIFAVPIERETEAKGLMRKDVANTQGKISLEIRKR